jgi:DNA-binding NtrC family response regulator
MLKKTFTCRRNLAGPNALRLRQQRVSRSGARKNCKKTTWSFVMSGFNGGLRGRRVMVLEDDVLIAMDMEDFLISEGCQVVGPISNVEAALEKVETAQLDGAVVDLNLRGELSVPVIEALKSRGVPVIVCSGYAELPGVQEMLKDVPMVPKPCDFNALSQILAETFTVTSAPQPAEN